MDYLDFELKIGAGAGRDYPVEVVRSPAGEPRATMHFPFDELALQNHLQALQIALLRSGGTRRDLAAPQERQSVQDFGRTLFSALLPDEVRSCYRISREKALAEGKGLRLRLRIEAPDLAALPWEFLYDDAEGDFICLSNETPVIRYLELDRPPTPLTIAPPLRILGMIASPDDRATLNVARERQRMEHALAGLEARGVVALTWLEGQTWRDLLRAMRQGPWHVFHFVGHGGFDAAAGEGMLALCDERGQTFRLPATKLGRLLADHNALRLAVLNACEGAQASETDIFSSTASVLIRRGIPAVVAMQYEITDRAAIEFARVFYEALAEGLPVDAAVAEGRKAVSLSAHQTVEWGTPVLHMRAPDGRLFDVDTSALPAAEAPPPEAPEEEAVLAPEGTDVQEARQAPPDEAQGPALPPPAEERETPLVAPPPVAATAPERAASRLSGLRGKMIYALAGGAAVVVLALVVLMWGGDEPPPPPGEGMGGTGAAILAACYNGAWVEAGQPSYQWTFEIEGDQLHVERSDQAFWGTLVLEDGAWRGALLEDDPAGDFTTYTEDFVLQPASGSCTEIQTNQAWHYVRPGGAATEGAPGGVAADVKPLRVFMSDEGGMLTTTLEAVAGFEDYGMDACLLSDPEAGTKPLYSYLPDGEVGRMFTATTASGIPGIRAEDAFEGTLEGYVFTDEQRGTVPLVLYSHEEPLEVVAIATRDFQTIMEESGFTRVRVEGYVYPAGYCSE